MGQHKNLFVHIVNSWTDQPDYEVTSLAAALASFVEAPGVAGGATGTSAIS